MPRRRGRERTPTQARREVAEFALKYPALAKARREGLGFRLNLDPRIATGGKQVQNVPAGTMLCHHNQPWTTCTICSKPVRRA